MTIRVSGLHVAFGDVAVIHGLSFEVGESEFLTLLGPSGCGKTTTLRCIAGLEMPDAGIVEIDGEPVFDRARGIAVPPHERKLGMVFQSYAIWPHLTVADNVAFPLAMRGLKGGKEASEAVGWALDVVGMGAYAARRPSELSGGQQQRVALARAIVGKPKVLLFDEPLSNLDAKLRDRTRIEIRQIQRRLGVPAVYVTHDQAEALAMSDRVIVMNAGRIEQASPPRDIYRNPVNRFVADFVGQANFLLLRAKSGRWVAPDGTAVQVRAAGAEPGDEETHSALLRPESVLLSAARPEAAGANVWRGRVVEATYVGPWVEYRLEAAGVALLAFSPVDLAVGDDVWVSFRSEDVRLLPRE